MSFSSGDSIGVYRITALIGEGGMGQVYRAHDSTLGRDVAIKVLPEALESDAERVARFAREAKSLAALNHPHVATLYGMEHDGSRHFLVMELVEGETLADRIRRGPLPVAEALFVARQIADALEGAHERGIIHRDLKPANIKVTPDEVVKVLDFGLAKAMDPVGPGAASMTERTNSPTLSVMATSAGIILGTAAYMSPEQAKGLPVDHRTDIFAFGCVVFEMLAGRPAFDGETVTDVLASIVARDPEWNALPKGLDPRVRRLLERCLAKSRRQRWQAIGDVRAEIELIASSPASTATTPVATSPLWRRAVTLTAVAAIAATIGATATWRLRPEERRPVVRSVYPLPEGLRFTNTGRHLLALSPDGTQLAYVANNRIHVRRLAEFSSQVVAESQQGLVAPVFSPDGTAIAYWAADDQKIKRVAITGGAPVTISAATRPYGIAWHGNEIYFGQGAAGISRVSAAGGTPEVIVRVSEGEVAHGPRLMPDGRTVIFTVAKGRSTDRWNRAQVVAQVIGAVERKVLLDSASDARYLPTGHLVYAQAGVVFAVGFDADRLATIGVPVPVLEGVLRADSPDVNSGAAQFDVSGSGALAYIPGPEIDMGNQARTTIAMVDRAGKQTHLVLRVGSYDTPRLAPDGRRVAYSSAESGALDIYIHELSSTAPPRRLTFSGQNRFPVWSADGSRIIFESDRDGASGLYWQSSDGSETPVRLTAADKAALHYPQAITPDGKTLLFVELKGGTFATFALTLANKQAQQLTELGTSNTIFPSLRLSPDGAWIAYNSVEPSGSRVRVQPLPLTGSVYEVGAGATPVWTRDGKAIIYVSNREFRVATISTQSGFRVVHTTAIPGVTYQATALGPQNFDVMPDGKIIMRVIADEANDPLERQINIVLNWFEELKTRAPR